MRNCGRRAYCPSFEQVNRMSQKREKIHLEFNPGRCLPGHLGHSDTVPSKEKTNPGPRILRALRDRDKIHTALLSSAGESRTRIVRSARLCSIRVVVWHPPLSSSGGYVTYSPTRGISSQILDATRWLMIFCWSREKGCIASEWIHWGFWSAKRCVRCVWNYGNGIFMRPYLLAEVWTV